MRKLAFLSAIVMLASVALGQTAKMSSGAGDVAQLKEIENKWMNAEMHGDAAYLDTILAPDFTYTGPGAAVMNRTELLDRVKSGKTKMEAGSVSDMNVRVYGNAAVVTGAYTQKGTEGEKAFDDSGRFTDTFIKKAGKWLAVATHSSLQPPVPQSATTREKK